LCNTTETIFRQEQKICVFGSFLGHVCVCVYIWNCSSKTLWDTQQHKKYIPRVAFWSKGTRRGIGWEGEGKKRMETSALLFFILFPSSLYARYIAQQISFLLSELGGGGE
jgi:hypothetical protein